MLCPLSPKQIEVTAGHQEPVLFVRSDTPLCWFISTSFYWLIHFFFLPILSSRKSGQVLHFYRDGDLITQLGITQQLEYTGTHRALPSCVRGPVWVFIHQGEDRLPWPSQAKTCGKFRYMSINSHSMTFLGHHFNIFSLQCSDLFSIIMNFCHLFANAQHLNVNSISNCQPLVLYFTLIGNNGGHRDTLFIVYFLVQTVQYIKEGPTNNPPTMLFILYLAASGICYASLITAPKNH